MFNRPSKARQWAALGLVSVGFIVMLGLGGAGGDSAAPALPTRMLLPSQPPTAQPTHTPVVAALQPTSLPPTSVPTETLPPAATDAPTRSAVQPSPHPFQSSAQLILIPPPVQPVPNQLTIQFAPGTPPEQQVAYVQQLGGAIERNLGAINTVVVTIPDAVSAQVLPPSPIVVQAEPDYYVVAQQSTPNDPLYSQQWALPVMNVPDAWPLLPPDTPSIAVAVIDSGICANHPDLAGRILPGYDFIQSDTTPQDEYGHGCGVAGVIAANPNNSQGIAGVAPNTRIMPLRVLDAQGSGTYSNVAAAMIYAADNGAQIINLSLGGASPSTTLENAVNYAVERGVLVVAAAGNTGGSVIYPAAYADVVAVASVDQNLQRSSFSSYGPEVDLLAPGRDIMTTRADGTYAPMTGTSFAAPQVAGIAALELAQGRGLTQDGGLAQVYIPAPTPPPTVEPTVQVDKNGNPIPQSTENQPVPTDTWAVILEPGSDPNAVAAQLGFENLGQIGTLENTYLFRAPSSGSSLQAAQDTASTLQASAQVVWFEQQFAQQQIPRNPGDDPKYSDQWHLNNTGQNGATSGEDANILDAWNAGYTGIGAQIAVVDDGLQYVHPDLASNYVAEASYDFNYGDPNPEPGNGDPHGTAAAGVAAGVDNSTGGVSDCGVGVAYDASVSGIRLIAGASTDAMEASALTYQNGSSVNPLTQNDIYSNSWGPSDNGQTLKAPGLLTLTALLNSVTYGRGGRGNVYVWAAGNGLENLDNINADGYANSRFVIAVGAVGSDGKQAYYSEPGAPMLVTAPSSSAAGPGITTTDLIGPYGYNPVTNGGPADYGDTQNCTKYFGGTSAATPLVSGVVALMLQANPNLTWRDVQYILLQTAEKNDPTDSDWTTNGAGYDINHKYGFGRVDAAAAVSEAATWQHVGPEGSTSTSVQIVDAQILDDSSLTRTLNISTTQPVEHVEVIFNATHTYRGDLEIILESPQGTESRLMEQRPADGLDNYTNWKFTTVRHWGENPQGVWKLTVRDVGAGDTGRWLDWKLIIYTQQPPPVPVPTAPNNGTLINTFFNSTPITFNWTTTAPFNLNGYELRLDSVNPPINTISVASTDYSTSLPLGKYYWQVRAVGNSTVGNSGWSAVRSFTIGVTNNVAPVRNYFTTATPVLTWNRLSWATGYEVEVSTSSSFTGTPVFTYQTLDPSLLSVTVIDPVTLPTGLGEGIYYWRVRGRKPDGTWSTTWSASDSFVVDLPP